nr:tetratricopeptide-like helical [Tanacetum cinerariifolium]
MFGLLKRLQENTKYFALSEYAIVGGALTLYDVEDKNATITEMEYVSISLKGNPGMARENETCRKFNLKQFVLHCWSATMVIAGTLRFETGGKVALQRRFI